MKNDDLLLELGRLTRKERDVVRAPASEESNQLDLTAKEDIELYGKLATPLSDEAMDRVLKGAGLDSWPGDPVVSVNAPSLGSETPSPPQAVPSSRKAGPAFPATRPRWSRLFRGAGLAIPLAAVVVVALLRVGEPEPFPATELTAILRDGEPLVRGAPIRLAVQRSENSVVLKFTPERPVGRTVDSKVFVEGNDSYYDIASRAAVGAGGEVSVEVEVTSISGVPSGPAHLVVFVGRKGHLPSNSDEAKVARSKAAASSPYRMFVQDIVVGNEVNP